MWKFTPAVAVAILTLATGSASAQLQVPSTWKNEGGSVLSISSVDQAGVFKGTFVNNKQGFECIGKEYQVKGRKLPKNPYFAVSFNDCYTVTIWHFTVHGDKMNAPWKLWYAGSDGQFHALSGIDTFTKQ